MRRAVEKSLFSPSTIGASHVANRFVMAPMTRCRAEDETLMPTAAMVDYYAQRGSAGLIISEGIVVSPMAKGFIRTPGLFTVEHVAVWRKVTDAVHAANGRIFAQLWHVGRMSHVDVLSGKAPIGPSAINAEGIAYTAAGFAPTSLPREMTVEDIHATIEEFATAATNAIQAGFDGVELHAANGYIFHQFLAPSANHRMDGYGGSIDNRSRFLFETVEAVAAKIGIDRVGVRLNPDYEGSGIVRDEALAETFDAVVSKLGDYDIAYLHLTNVMAGDRENRPFGILANARHYRSIFNRPLMINNGLTLELAQSAFDEGIADYFAFGTPFISNPDLVERLAVGLPLTEPDQATFYEAGERGYTDYPTAAAQHEGARQS